MSKLVSHFLKITDAIHKYLLAEYRIGKLSILIPLRYCCLPLFLVTNTLYSVPDMSEHHNTVKQPTAFSGPETAVYCSIGNHPDLQDKMNLFHWQCRYHLCKIPEASLMALWICLIQHLQHQHHPFCPVPC